MLSLKLYLNYYKLTIKKKHTYFMKLLIKQYFIKKGEKYEKKDNY